jgi:DNA gyrase subunit B
MGLVYFMARNNANTRKYGADDIQVLEGLEPVRKRPGMYIGSTGPDGLHHLLVEIFDNSRDEAMNGYADEIEVALLPDGAVRVVDNGTGIPVEIHKKTKVSTLETVLTVLHAGGKFEGEGYKISGGLHGVGASVVNALSEWLTVRVHRDGAEHFQEYARGKKKANVKKVGSSKETGTIIAWKPDPEIFSETVYDWPRVVNHLRGQAYLVKKLRVRVIDARAYEGKLNIDQAFFLGDLNLPVPSSTFYFEGGLLSLIKFYNQRAKSVQKNIFYIDKEVETDNSKGKKVAVELALQYVDDIDTKEISYTNNTITPEGGMHVTGFRTALTRTLNDYAKKANLIKDKDDNFTGEDVREGLVTVISIKLRDPQFEGQTKAKLGSVEARTAVEQVFGDAFTSFLEENPDDGKAIINKVLLAVRARKAAKAAKDSVLRKGALEGMTLPGKLADCQTKDASESELFVVEGDSAGGTAKTGRDRRTQAILPLRGKILNIERARLDRMLASEQIKNLVIALGAAIGDTFDITKLRYGKIIIASDADVDGAHIRTLLLTLFFRYYRELIDAGHLYIAQPPLYKIKKGKEIRYAYTDAEKDRIIKELGGEISDTGEDDDEVTNENENPQAEEVKVKKTARISIQRYKGLGEMNADELWETTMDPAKRLLKQVNVEEASEADQTFDILMGNDVEPRKIFIQTHAKLANIDI